MKTHIGILCLFLLFPMAFVGPGCHHPAGPPPEPPPNDPRTYAWSIDTLAEPSSVQTTMRTMWGSSPSDIYVVGHGLRGHRMFHYDGAKWNPVGLQLGEGGSIANIGTLWNIHGFAANDIFAVGERAYYDANPPFTYTDSSLIIHFNGGTWTEMKTPPGRGIVGICMIPPPPSWAGGTNGTLFHYDGSSWKVGGTFSSDIWFARFSGFSSGDVYALAYSIPDSVNKWHTYYLWHWNGLVWTLLDSFPENQGHKFGCDALIAIGGDLYSAGRGIFRKSGSSWTRVYYNQGDYEFTSIRGNSSSNVFAVGGQGLMVHCNGTDWFRYSQFVGIDVLFCDLWTDGNEVFVVGNDGSKSYMYHGK